MSPSENIPPLKTRTSRPTQPSVVETGSTDSPSGSLAVMVNRHPLVSTSHYPYPFILSPGNAAP